MTKLLAKRNNIRTNINKVPNNIIIYLSFGQEISAMAGISLKKKEIIVSVMSKYQKIFLLTSSKIIKILT